MRILLAGLLGFVGALPGGCAAGNLGYKAAFYVSLWIWPDVRQSNLAGLPAACFGLFPGFAAGAVAGCWAGLRLAHALARYADASKPDVARDEPNA